MGMPPPFHYLRWGERLRRIPTSPPGWLSRMTRQPPARTVMPPSFRTLSPTGSGVASSTSLPGRLGRTTQPLPGGWSYRGGRCCCSGFREEGFQWQFRPRLSGISASTTCAHLHINLIDAIFLHLTQSCLIDATAITPIRLLPSIDQCPPVNKGAL